ncbi:MarR family transcriptional regulator [Geodermatophilus sp. TF02-6]|uniref:MarR family winged helix-turn-helix transcriptional regulator n=1 Tax=Geodermatophilus sp. TF02-6 TaxID=2250575 RepID=UPI000DE91F4B|nr:MarR family winged helix-turn-helix transcriptional regulator [Geodermatophilus sp. TF02-6]RBY81716.1 MarR family transcriptional regulator [Geodermatophilus sp. TF02-6]
MPITPTTIDRLGSGVAALLRTGRHLGSRVATELYGDLPSSGWALLVSLERDGEQRCSALAVQAGVDVSVVSRQVATLERGGYVERRPDPEDGRASLIGLSPAGVKAMAATRAVRASWAASALAGWDDEDGRRLSELLERLIADLEAAGRPAAAPPPRRPADAAPR